MVNKYHAGVHAERIIKEKDPAKRKEKIHTAALAYHIRAQAADPTNSNHLKKLRRKGAGAIADRAIKHTNKK